MTAIRLLDTHARDDLELFALRAQRLDSEAVMRIEVYRRAIAAYVAPLYAQGLHDAMPTTLGVRTFPIIVASDLEPVVVPITDLLACLGAMRRADDRDLILEPSSVNAVWLGISPPRTGWERTGNRVRQCDVRAVCERGVADVAAAVEDSAGAIGKVGTLALQKVRGRIWSEQPTELSGAPSSVAFVADGLGFLRGHDDADAIPTIAVFRHHHWYRLSFPYGEVLTHSRFL